MTGPLQPEPILQDQLGFAPWHLPRGDRLPGTGPSAPEDWLRLDDAYAPQMALRDRLLAERSGEVLADTPGSEPAQAELLELGLDWIGTQPNFTLRETEVTRPDGRRVPLDPSQPLRTLGRLVQQDLCLMQPDGAGEHRLTAAILCFPASWRLAEKLGRPLTGIHRPVAEYEPDLAKRVQRMFDALRPGVVLQRANCLAYEDPSLFVPRGEQERRVHPGAEPLYLRLERQTLRRLPQSGAIVFAIHTAVVRRTGLSPEDRDASLRYLAAHNGPNRPGSADQ